MRIGSGNPHKYIRNLSREPERGLPRRRRRRHVGLTNESKAIILLISLTLLGALVAALALGIEFKPNRAF